MLVSEEVIKKHALTQSMLMKQNKALYVNK